MKELQDFLNIASQLRRQMSITGLTVLFWHGNVHTTVLECGFSLIPLWVHPRDQTRLSDNGLYQLSLLPVPQTLLSPRLSSGICFLLFTNLSFVYLLHKISSGLFRSLRFLRLKHNTLKSSNIRGPPFILVSLSSFTI